MAKAVIAYASTKGAIFTTADKATISDIEQLLDCNYGTALSIFEERERLVDLFVGHAFAVMPKMIVADTDTASAS